MFKIAHITDLHLGKPQESYLNLDLRGRFLAVLDQAVKDQLDLIVLGGDYSLHDPDEAACIWLRQKLDTTGIPYFVLAGNHDSSQALIDVFTPNSLSDHQLYYQFVAGGFQHLVLDSSLGYVGDEQLAWLKNTLSTASNPVIWIHHPPTLLGAPFMDSKHALKERQPLLDILFDYKHPLHIFCGHYHCALNHLEKNLSIHVAPPTSFYIHPDKQIFQQEHCSPGYQLLLLSDDKITAMPRFVS